MTFLRTTALMIIALITAGVALVAIPRPAGACYCAWWGEADSQLGVIDFNDISVAFAGRQTNRGGGTRLVFEVDRVFKGRAGPVLETHTPDSSCGANFAGWGIIGAVATTWEGDPSVGVCSRVAIEELEEAFGPGYPPDETMVEAAELLENPTDRPSSDIAAIEESEATFGPGYPPEENAGPRNGASAVTVILLIGGAVAALAGGATLMRNRRRRSN